MAKKQPMKPPEGIPAENPLERLQAALVKLTDISTAIKNLGLDIEAANMAMLNVAALQSISMDSLGDPIATGDRVETRINLLTQVEELAKGAASDVREAGKLAEHLRFSIVSTHREVMARYDHEKALQAERAAGRKNSGDRGGN